MSPIKEKEVNQLLSDKLSSKSATVFLDKAHKQTQNVKIAKGHKM